MKLHILGNGGPRPNRTGERYGTSCILDLGDERILIDCGPGTTYKMARMGMRPTEIDTVFLSHHHSDHIVDFPCFALLRFDLDPGDLSPLSVFGPPPTAAFVDRLFGDEGAFKPDIVARREHPISHHGYVERGGTMPRPGMRIQARDLDPSMVVEGKGWRASAAQVPHVDPYLISLACRFDTDRGSLLFLGDAAVCPGLAEYARGVDTIVTGVVNLNFKEGDASHPIRGVSADISEVVDIAVDTEASRVVLIHGSPLDEEIVARLRRGYGGRGYVGDIVRPDELTTVELQCVAG